MLVFACLPRKSSNTRIGVSSSTHCQRERQARARTGIQGQRGRRTLVRGLIHRMFVLFLLAVIEPPETPSRLVKANLRDACCEARVVRAHEVGGIDRSIFAFQVRKANVKVDLFPARVVKRELCAKRVLEIQGGSICTRAREAGEGCRPEASRLRPSQSDQE